MLCARARTRQALGHLRHAFDGLQLLFRDFEHALLIPQKGPPFDAQALCEFSLREFEPRPHHAQEFLWKKLNRMSVAFDAHCFKLSSTVMNPSRCKHSSTASVVANGSPLPLKCRRPCAIAISTRAARSSAVARLSLDFIASPTAYAAGGATLDSGPSTVCFGRQRGPGAISANDAPASAQPAAGLRCRPRRLRLR